MSGLRVSRIVVQLVCLDEYDAIKETDPIVFSGDADGPAATKVAAWLDELPQRLAEAKERDAVAGVEQQPPNRAQRRTSARKRQT